MTKRCDYITTTGDERFEERVIVRAGLSGHKRSVAGQNRTFIPFSGFDGQHLAGSGALVWEGELLQERLN
ncbi:MAG: hypothetical protein AAF412_00365 [Pseudomonadota bacterium]